MVKVSVIVPAYNAETYVEKCVESLMNQSLKELEVIIVDDGSKDNTLSILKKYEEEYPNILKVFHKENGGQASARNLALEYATGEYIGFVDSDDWVSLDMYEKMYQKAKETDADIVVCDSVEQYEDGENYQNYTTVPNKLAFAGGVLNKIFRREFAAGTFFPKGLWYEDLEYSAMLFMKTDKISIIHEGLYQYNCRDGSTMHNNNAQKNKDILTVLNHVWDFVEENGWQEKYKEELEYLYLEHILYTAINRLENQQNTEKREVINYLRKEVLKKYPKFYKSKAFKEYEKKKQVVTFLNAKGFSQVVKAIFDYKSKMRDKKEDK